MWPHVSILYVFIVIYLHIGFPFQLLPGRLPYWRLHQRLPWCLLSTLHRCSVRRAGGTLHSLHGQLWWLQLMWPHRQRIQTLGVQQASVAEWATQVLREVPALHPLFPGLWVSSWQRILLYLWVSYRCLLCAIFAFPALSEHSITLYIIFIKTAKKTVKRRTEIPLVSCMADV